MAGGGLDAALEQIRQRMQSAMSQINAKAMSNMQQETQGFYSGGSPTIYSRTGQLGSSPRTSGVQGGGNSYSVKMYLQIPSYAVPNPAFTSRGFASYFSGLQALNAAEYHFAHVKGRPGFWNRANQKTIHDAQSILASYFH
ncbi:MAG: hypothetical protein IKO36_06225 [Bacteroidaceae bacterium]|nr:hypothetical protein [Bacteroidaceae bacterium]